MPVRFALFFITAGLCYGQIAAAPGGAASQNRYKVSGTVINSQTGEPIPRALVSGPGLTNGPVFTDGSGKFEADNVPEGPAFFGAQRPGFFPEGSGYGSTMPRTPNQKVDASHTSVQVKLVPMASIHGRVTDTDNQPVESVRVQLVSRMMQNGIFQWRPMNSANTDETGSFTFPELIPGTYVLRAAPKRLYLDNSDLVIDGQHYPDFYAGAYFPGVPDRASAQPIALTPGANYEADLRVRLVATYSVSGTARSGIRGGVGCIDESGEFVSGNGPINPRTGQFKLTGVSPGACMLTATSYGQNGPGPVAELPINITSEDLTGVSLTFHEPISNIPINVTGLPADQKTQPLNLLLVSLDERPHYQTNVENRNESDGNHSFIRNPMPGNYRLMALSFGNMCVASMQAGGIDLTKENLVISRDSAPSQIDIALRSDCGSVTLTVEGAAAGSVTPVLMTGGAYSPRLVYVGGKFMISPLEPGDYTFYALSDASNLEYGKAEVLKKLSGQQISVAPSEKATIQLKVQTPPAETAQ